jgi:hypothetical protein
MQPRALQGRRNAIDTPSWRGKYRRAPGLFYRLVTIGGGGVVQPAIVASASTAMITSETFFISESPVP